MTAPREKRAFTLIELVVSIVILGILALIAIPTFTKVIDESSDRAALASLQAIARNAQALNALKGAPSWDAESAETAISEVAALHTGALAAGTLRPQEGDVRPERGSVTYTFRTEGPYRGQVQFAGLSETGNVCVVVAQTSGPAPGGCADLGDKTPGEALDTGTIPLPSGAAQTPNEPGEPGGNTPEVPEVPAYVLTPTVTGGHDSAQIRWNLPAEDATEPVEGYTIHRSTSTEGPWTQIGTRSATGNLHKDVALLTGTYCYKVEAVPGGQSGTVCTTVTNTGAPFTPAPVAATQRAGQVTLSWVQPGAVPGRAVQGFKVYRDGAVLATVPSQPTGTTVTYTDWQLRAGEVHEYELVTYNTHGESDKSMPVTAGSTDGTLLNGDFSQGYGVGWEGTYTISPTYKVQSAQGARFGFTSSGYKQPTGTLTGSQTFIIPEGATSLKYYAIIKQSPAKSSATLSLVDNYTKTTLQPVALGGNAYSVDLTGRAGHSFTITARASRGADQYGYDAYVHLDSVRIITE